MSAIGPIARLGRLCRRTAGNVIALCILAVPSAALGQERHALVVGINAYESVPQLVTAVNDAEAIAATLEATGFTVDMGTDLNRRDFTRVLATFLDRLQPEDEALVFYAGHAVAIGNENYLVPADVSALEQSSEALIIAESIGQDFLLEQITATGVRLTVMIMDACRDNPFEGLATRSIGRTRGLAITQPPRGVFMMFSADEGQRALDALGEDDANPNSVFTRTLIPLLQEPGLDIVDIARRLRGDVQALAASVNHQQFPVYRDRMQGDGRFVLTPAILSASAGDRDQSPAGQPGQTDACGPARADLALLGQTPTRASLEAFIETYPGCSVPLAIARGMLDRLYGEEGNEAPAPEIAEGDAPTGLASVEACESYATPSDTPFTGLSQDVLNQAETACMAALSRGLEPGSESLANVSAILGRIHHARENYQQAAQYYATAAEAGHPIALLALGGLYAGGQGVGSDQARAVELYRQSAEAGEPEAMHRLGYMYQSGRGVAQDGAEAVRWYQAGADAGNGAAMAALAYMYQMGQAVPQSIPEALRLYELAAENGHARAMATLGWLYENGRDVARNYQTAAYWYERGAQAGNAAAMDQLARMYADGRGVPQSDVQALHWYQEGAAAGNAASMIGVGWMYQTGSGGAPLDPGTAADWYLRGLAAGNTWPIENARDMTSEVASEVQRRLQAEGYYTGTIDGAAGPGTVRAMQAYQDAH